MKPPEISVVMPTYNKQPRLRLALQSLTCQTMPVDKWELVLVDDGSDTRCEKLLEELQPSFRINYIYQPNSGRSVARNNGIARTQGKLIVFMDDDLIASPQYIEAHAKTHAHSKNMVVHGAIYELSYFKFYEDPVEGRTYTGLKMSSSFDVFLEKKRQQLLMAFADFPLFAKIFTKKSRYEKDVQRELGRPKNKMVVPWLGFTGGNVSIEKQWLELLEGFDERLGKDWGAEDWELGFRLYKKGLGWCYVPAAANYHISHYRKNMMGIGRQAYEYCYKKHDAFAIRQLWDYLAGLIDIDTYNAQILAHEDIRATKPQLFVGGYGDR